MEQNIQVQPLVSIITVCFNSEKTIRQTIESVLNQTYTNIEYVLVDGKSTDSTVAIIEEYAPLFAERGIQYRWISEPDDGIYDAMNKGIKIAIGQYINFQGSDDWLELNAAAIVKDNCNNCAEILCFATDIWQNSDFTTKHSTVFPNKDGFLFYKSVAIHQSIFVERELMRVGFSIEYKIAADFDFLLNQYLNDVNFYYSELIVANFTTGGASGAVLECLKDIERIYYKHMPNKFWQIKLHFGLLKFRCYLGKSYLGRVLKIIRARLYCKI